MMNFSYIKSPVIKILSVCCLQMFTYGIVPDFTSAEDLMLRDLNENLLLQVSDDGSQGSLTLPSSTSVPAETGIKLYNVNGVLFWKDAQLSTGWSRSGNDVHLSHSSDSAGIGISAPTSGSRMEVAGQVKITGGLPVTGRVLTSDAGGLATWEQNHPTPVASYVGGNYSFQLAATPRLAKQIAITVPAAGTIHVSVTGYVSWGGYDKDSIRLSLTDSSSSNMDSGFMFEMNDQGCTDYSDQYDSWKTQRSFDVAAAGTYTYYLWADAPMTDNVDPCVSPTDMNNPTDCGTGLSTDKSQSRLDDINLFAKYWPTE